MSAIVFDHVCKAYRGHAAISDLTLTVADQSLTVLCGPPRSGKSVLLRLLVGLEMPDSGRILIDGQDVTRRPAAERRIGYVPQSFALFPHMNVYDNIAYPLRQQGAPAAMIKSRIDRVAEILRIGPLLGKRPSQLSGGEKQRAAIARGTLKDARIFILDDPLVGLDFKLRESLMDDLKDMRASLGATFLYATSDSLEALTMAEQLAVMDNGRVLESGPVDRVYHEPRTARSAELVGFPRCNLFAGTARSGLCQSAIGAFQVPSDTAEAVLLAVRPEDVVHPPSQIGGATMGGVGTISLLENLGAECVVYVQFGGATVVSIPPADAVIGLDVGSDFAFSINRERVMIFDQADGIRRERTREMAHG
jgi:ABC-type sugar transport system ATPase subunit